MNMCRDCGYVFTEPGTTTSTDGIRGFDGPFFVECCPRCQSEDFFELYHAGECVKDAC